VSGNAAEGVVGVAVVDSPGQRVAAPTVPGVGISLDQVTEAGIMDHAVLVGVAVRRGGERPGRRRDIALCARPESSSRQAQRPVKTLLEEHFEGLAGDAVHDDAEEHESQVGVVAPRAHGPA